MGGYENSILDIYSTTQEILKGIEKIPEFIIHGTPITSVIAFRFNEKIKLNIFTLSEAMDKRGWGLSKLQHPNCLHICVTGLWSGRAQEFLEALRKRKGCH